MRIVIPISGQRTIPHLSIISSKFHPYDTSWILKHHLRINFDLVKRTIKIRQHDVRTSTDFKRLSKHNEKQKMRNHLRLHFRSSFNTRIVKTNLHRGKKLSKRHSSRVWRTKSSLSGVARGGPGPFDSMQIGFCRTRILVLKGNGKS